jgi:hypothetical protein
MKRETNPKPTAKSKSAGLVSTKARYVIIGGFLGAGKTTSVLKLAEWLRQRASRVGLISNDQGSGLVDTAMLFVSALSGVGAIWRSLESFKPGKPQPTHRVTALPRP